MDFFIRLPLVKDMPRTTLDIKNVPEPSAHFNIVSLLGQDSVNKTEVKFNAGLAVFIGDPVFHRTSQSNLKPNLEQGHIGTVIRETDGFYYLLVIYHNEQKLIIASGNFSVIPVYYSETGDVLTVSSSFGLIAFQDGNCSKTTDVQYYLEKALFNYPLFNRTPLKEVSLLPSNSYLEYCNSKFIIRKHTDIYDFFTPEPGPWRASLEEISGLFIEKARAFIPDSPGLVALTGGYDSRAVAGIASGSDMISGSFTYGSRGDHDITIASEISRFLNISHVPVVLDEDYAAKYFWQNGLEFLKKSDGLGNFSRSHYNFILENYLKGHPYLLTGNFGSEILRSAKVPGVVTSGALFKVFAIKNREVLEKELRSEPGMRYLNRAVTESTLHNVVEEIKAYSDKMPGWISLNQRFYAYIFEEVFRKYFGPEIMVQRGLIKHRAPFLCFSFIEGILKTGLAGANGNFMENNPLKRYQGQVFYASVLKKTSPSMLHFKLDRGYRPADLLMVSGNLNIMAEYIKKKVSVKRRQVTPDYLSLSLAANMKHFREVDADRDLFDRSYLETITASNLIPDQVNFVNMMSAVVYRNLIRAHF